MSVSLSRTPASGHQSAACPSLSITGPTGGLAVGRRIPVSITVYRVKYNTAFHGDVQSCETMDTRRFESTPVKKKVREPLTV